MNNSQSIALRNFEAAFVVTCTDRRQPLGPLVARYLMLPRVRELIREINGQQIRMKRYSRNAAPLQRTALAHLVAQGLLRPIGKPVDRRSQVYWLRPCGGPEGPHDPIEVLTAIHKEGIVSHLSALLVHELLLETRPDAHYPTKPVAATSVRQHKLVSSSPPNRGNEAPKPRVGTLVMTLDGLPFRLRTMTTAKVFGVARRWTTGGIHISVFDLERSLLLCLSDPQCNGGLRGILKAWENGAERVREQRMIDYLGKTASLATWRRTGLMAERVGLEQLRKECLGAIRDSPTPSHDRSVSLVRGISHGRQIEPWGVAVPW